MIMMMMRRRITYLSKPRKEVKVSDPLISFKPFGNYVTQLRTAKSEPSTRSDTIGLILEFGWPNGDIVSK